MQASNWTPSSDVKEPIGESVLQIHVVSVFQNCKSSVTGDLRWQFRRTAKVA